MAIDAVITVRSSSSRFPNKCFAKIDDNNTVIEHVVKRALHFGLKPLIATTADRSDDRIEMICKNLDVRCFRGSSCDKLGRWNDACKKFEVDSFVTVDADDPFFDRTLTLAVYGELCADISIEVVSQDVSPDGPYLGSHGFAVKSPVLDRSMLARAGTGTHSDDRDTEDFMRHLVSSANVVKFKCPQMSGERDLRLTLDYEDDLALIRLVSRECSGMYATREKIVDFIRMNPSLKLINKHCTHAWLEHRSEKIAINAGIASDMSWWMER